MSGNDSSLNDLPLRTIEQIFRNMNLDVDVTFPINNITHEIFENIRIENRNNLQSYLNENYRRNSNNLQYILNELNSSGTNSITVRENELTRQWEITDSDESELETLDSHSDQINIEDNDDDNEHIDTKEDIIVPKCSVCYENNSIIMFIGCGHVCSCNECSNRLSNCPICRMRINGRQRIFFS